MSRETSGTSGDSAVTQLQRRARRWDAFKTIAIELWGFIAMVLFFVLAGTGMSYWRAFLITVATSGCIGLILRLVRDFVASRRTPSHD